MPDKPIWCGRLKEIAGRLRGLSDSWVDRPVLQEVLGIGRRRAQQILAPCVTRQVGKSGLAPREAVLERLQRLAGGEEAYYERRRQRHLAEQLEKLREDLLRRPRVLVEAPATVQNQKFEGLPEGVAVVPGKITVRFDSATEALEKLLALAMAIGNDRDQFERLATGGELSGAGNC